MPKIQGIYERIPIAVDMFRFTGSVLYDTRIGFSRITEVVCGKTAVVVFELPPTLSKIPEGTIVHVSCPKSEVRHNRYSEYSLYFKKHVGISVYPNLKKKEGEHD